MSYPQGNQQAPWATSGVAGTAGAAQSWQSQSTAQNPYEQYASNASAGMTAEQQALLYQQQTANTTPAAATNWQGLFTPSAADGQNQTAATQATQATSPWGAQSASSWAAAAASKVQSTTQAAGQPQAAAQQSASQSPWSTAPAAQQPWAASSWGSQSTSWQAPTQAAVQDYQSQAKVWLGIVTQLIPPNYGIVDSVAFYVHEVVTPGTKLPQVGDRVKVEALPATDGGQYSWRCTRVEVDSSTPQPKAATPSATVAAMAAAAASSTPGVTANPYGATTVTLPTAKGSSASAVPTAIAANKPFFRGSTLSSSRLGISSHGKTASLDKASADAKYNMVAPPTSSYTADLALAAAANAIESAMGVASTAVVVDSGKKSGFAKPPPQLSEEERKKSEQAVQQLKNYGDPSGIGARLLSKMGFGAAGGQGLGKNEQGIAAPVDPKSTMGQRGLGFDTKDRDRGRTYERRGSDSKRDSGWDSKRRRSYSRSYSRSRSRSYSRSRSRGRSRSRSPSVRYTCRPPKATTYDRWRGIASLSKRYSQMYIPSDFIKVESCWLDSCPEGNPLPLDKPVAFKIVEDEGVEREASSKEGSRPDAEGATSSSDLTAEEIAAGRLWSAKVLLMSGVSPAALHAAESRLFQHPVQNLKFLVGKRSKGELLLIGGQWEPVDGPPPHKEPWSLTRTAARTFKEATGLDLTQCTQWVKFAEAQYLRSSSGRTDTVLQRTAVFLVDVLSLTAPIPAALGAIHSADNASQEEQAAQQELEALEAELKESEAVGAAGQAGDKVELSNLTVAQLQEQLSKRGLDTKWQPLKGKKELVDRLREHMEQNPGAGEVVLPQAAARKDAQAALTELKGRVAQAQEKLAAARANSKSAPKLLDNPPCMEQVVVRSSKSGRMQCVSYSLDALLDYTLDDTKENTFEVSLFAELFLEMLQTRFGRVIYKCLPSIIEKIDKGRQDDKARLDERRNNREKGWDKQGDKGKISGKEPEAEVKADKGAEPGKGKEGGTETAKEPAAAVEVEKETKGKLEVSDKEATKDATAAMEVDQEADKADKEADKGKVEDGGKEASKQVAAEALAAEEEEKEAATQQVDGAVTAAAAVEDASQAGTNEAVADMATVDEGGAVKEEPSDAAPAANTAAAQPEPAITDAAAAAAAGVPAAAGTKRQLEDETEQGESKKVKSEPEADAAASTRPAAPPEKLLLACRFFDEKCAGYLDLEDLEEILFMTVQDVSRRRVQQLVEAVCKRDRMSYPEHSDMVASPSQSGSTASSSQATGDNGVSTSTMSGPGVVMIDGVALDLSQVQQKLASAEAGKRRAEVAASKLGQEAAALRAAEAKLKERVKNLMAQIGSMDSSLAAASSAQQQMETAVGKCVVAFQAAQAALQSGCNILNVPIVPVAKGPEDATDQQPDEVQVQDQPPAQSNDGVLKEQRGGGDAVTAPPVAAP